MVINDYFSSSFKHMKSIIPSVIVLFVSGALASCDVGKKNNIQQPASVQSPGLQLSPKQDSPLLTSQPGIIPTQSQPQPQVVTNSNNSNAKVNPAHGQPGHDCNIPVGAPLNSAPAAKPAAPFVTQPAATTIQPQQQPKGTVRLNPAHGQPGHDCNIPVGQPLRS